MVILFGGMLGAVVLILIWFVPQLLGDVHGIRQVWPQRLNQIQEWMHRTVPALNINAGEINSRVRELMHRNFQPAELTKGLIAIGTVLLTGAYFMVDGNLSPGWYLCFPRAINCASAAHCCAMAAACRSGFLVIGASWHSQQYNT
ncbi:MAG TPA: hypothetical protein VFR24_05675 [Candidatus Angelobacter sp.]|nr:hypothetical protein [Candidatus Angelobacter sp.]